MILIISKPDDAHTVTIEKRIQQLEPDLPVVVLDTSLFPEKMTLQAHYGNGKSEYIFKYAGKTFSSSDIRSVWYRRPQRPTIPTSVTDEDTRSFIERESNFVVDGIWRSLNCFWVNDPVLNARANYKIYQLQIAQNFDFRIPNTIVSNDAEAVRTFWETNHRKIIYKQVRGISTRSVKTSLVTEKELGFLDSLQISPVIFQEYIPAQYDLRITVMGKKIFSAKIHSQKSDSKLDWRFDHARLLEPYTLPQEIEQKIRQYIDFLGLVYGAIDMRVTPEGEYVFFEINPSGQFVFVEILTELPLSEEFAKLLIRGHV
ncbi:MvdC/MvdD family ATP grasp protein [Candidatus Uabimicrobium amorphum]|uniref:ATP-grasp ribosomal peptide maturase n=1 Tax=Uabimicrobium amorphum TaxID=2596890 RepID=A0A5S9IVQ7_UABAM|nr:hypothetical protein [Candidatus Uabimicrobium amorphum]BBM88151.1 ATP-grasp ribosomal peptide maturase [Candidatus Uabimicrobium amorphum]